MVYINKTKISLSKQETDSVYKQFNNNGFNNTHHFIEMQNKLSTVYVK